MYSAQHSNIVQQAISGLSSLTGTEVLLSLGTLSSAKASSFFIVSAPDDGELAKDERPGLISCQTTALTGVVREDRKMREGVINAPSTSSWCFLTALFAVGHLLA